MLNKEILLTTSENLGTVTVTTSFLEELQAESRLFCTNSVVGTSQKVKYMLNSLKQMHTFLK